MVNTPSIQVNSGNETLRADISHQQMRIAVPITVGHTMTHVESNTQSGGPIVPQSGSFEPGDRLAGFANVQSGIDIGCPSCGTRACCGDLGELMQQMSAFGQRFNVPHPLMHIHPNPMRHANPGTSSMREPEEGYHSRGDVFMHQWVRSDDELSGEVAGQSMNTSYSEDLNAPLASSSQMSQGIDTDRRWY